MSPRPWEEEMRGDVSADACGQGPLDDQGHCTGAVKPPSPTVRGAFPTSRGISPVIGPPFVADAGVESVWFAPALLGTTLHCNSGVMPCTCAEAGAANTRPPTPTIVAAKSSRRIGRCIRVLLRACAPGTTDPVFGRTSTRLRPAPRAPRILPDLLLLRSAQNDASTSAANVRARAGASHPRRVVRPFMFRWFQRVHARRAPAPGTRG